VGSFKTSNAYKPTGDQPQAIDTIAASLTAGERYQTLLRATGTGKTATMAWTIERSAGPRSRTTNADHAALVARFSTHAVAEWPSRRRIEWLTSPFRRVERATPR
jgi:excinuclease ABC subunit B